MASPAASKLVRLLGIIFILTAYVILYRLFHDPVRQELRYLVSDPLQQSKLSPPNTDFSLVIDKIGASSNVVARVDPYQSSLYQAALARGIAQASGTSLPGEGGNIFLFAHSSADLLTAERYNSIFYLIHHLEPGDLIKVWYGGQEYHYAVTEKLKVAASDTQYLSQKTSEEQLTLMTCWPPGTTLKRLIIVAKPRPL